MGLCSDSTSYYRVFGPCLDFSLIPCEEKKAVSVLVEETGFPPIRIVRPPSNHGRDHDWRKAPACHLHENWNLNEITCPTFNPLTKQSMWLTCQPKGTYSRILIHDGVNPNSCSIGLYRHSSASSSSTKLASFSIRDTCWSCLTCFRVDATW